MIDGIEVIDTLKTEDTSQGTVRQIADFWSPQLENKRTILVYLPPSYEEEKKHYPVVYIHGSQGFFEQSDSDSGEWQANETMARLSRQGSPVIIVGIPNIDEHDSGELDPFTNRAGSGRGERYLTFLVDTLKPYIDGEFRTLPDRATTGIMGSLMGGMLSLYAFFHHAQTFGFAGVLSPSLGFAERSMFDYVRNAEYTPGSIYMDTGRVEGVAAIADVRRMCTFLIDKGYRPGRALLCVEEPEVDSGDSSWARRIYDALYFFLGSAYQVGPPALVHVDGESRANAVWPGKPYPLGATWDGQGVNFALFSEHATAVDLCLFDSIDASVELERIRMPMYTDRVWHVYIPAMQPGQLYGYRVYGPYDPKQGLRFNPHKLLVDPYAKALSGAITWNDTMFGYTIGGPEDDQTLDERDSAPFMPRAVVIDQSFDWGDDHLLNIPLHESIIYELHVKGFTRQHPDIPKHLRGTYAGLACPAAIEYLQSLGVTAVELLPIHQRVDDRHLVEKGLRNYWGYNTLGYFAPDVRYSSARVLGEQVREFKSMVKTMHAAGIEVILDVVYNHTAEGNHLGPTLSMKGIDNPVFYRLVEGNEHYYLDYTGTGNSLNMLHPRTLQLIMDSLRYWVLEMHVDGFRFDLAATLARGLHEVDRLSAFFDIIHQDPVLSQVKLIAEPWDVGPGGYQVGNFPILWAEWNGKYRDTVRQFWRGDEGLVSELAYRLSGSSDLYQSNGRSPYASINFITAHDGFTLSDLVSYNDRHNEANGEDNNDGEQHNNSWNCGAEGPTDDPDIKALRVQQQRNLLATLFLSQGVPMLLAGDERNRTQSGNNNAYCQDNSISWIDWQLDDVGKELLTFTRQLIKMRKEHPVLHRRGFFQGRSIHGQQVSDIEWFRPDGREMNDEEWSNGFVRCLGMRLNGQVMDEWSERGQHLRDDIFLILVNAYHEAVPFMLPGAPDELPWEAVLDAAVSGNPDSTPHPPATFYNLQGRSIAVLCQQYE